MLGHPVARVSAETIQIFAMESQRGEFWPRLRAVGCNIGWDFVPSISSFLTPKITSLNLTLPTESHRLLQPTLSLLTHTCRQLYSLAVDVDASDPLSGSEMVHLISASQHTLCRIQIKSPTPPDIFPVIFNCPRLRELALREPRLPNQIPPKTLPCLRTISLSGNHGSNLAAFLRSLPGLSTVNITDGEPIEFSALLGSLLGTAATINELNISPVITLDHASITSLPSFTNLTTLIASCVCWDSEASGPCNFQATDENILALGEALPHIRVLALGGPGCGAACRTTFKSLIHLSRTCGSLERLSIRVDFTSIIHDPDQLNRDNASQEINGARPQRAVNRLGTLAVGDSPLPNASRCEWVVALALVGIFPSITSLLFSCPESVQKRRWGGVKKNILVCKKILHIAQLIGKCPITHA